MLCYIGHRRLDMPDKEKKEEKPVNKGGRPRIMKEPECIYTIHMPIALREAVKVEAAKDFQSATMWICKVLSAEIEKRKNGR